VGELSRKVLSNADLYILELFKEKQENPKSESQSTGFFNYLQKITSNDVVITTPNNYHIPDYKTAALKKRPKSLPITTISGSLRLF